MPGTQKYSWWGRSRSCDLALSSPCALISRFWATVIWYRLRGCDSASTAAKLCTWNNMSALAIALVAEPPCKLAQPDSVVFNPCDVTSHLPVGGSTHHLPDCRLLPPSETPQWKAQLGAAVAVPLLQSPACAPGQNGKGKQHVSTLDSTRASAPLPGLSHFSLHNMNRLGSTLEAPQEATTYLETTARLQPPMRVCLKHCTSCSSVGRL